MVKDTLMELIFETKKSAQQPLADDCHFINVLGMKSLEVVTLIDLIREKFGVTLGEEPEDLEALLSFGTLASWIERKQQAVK